MKIRLGRRAFRYNLTAFALLFIGYLFTTGTELIADESAKNVFRLSAFLVFVANIAISRSASYKFIVGLALFFVALTISQSLVAGNLVFLIVISASLKKLTAKEAALSLLIPTAIVALLHVVMLNSGMISSSATDFGGRSRTALGFTNANQVSILYASLAVLSLFAHLLFRSRKSLFCAALSFSAAFLVYTYSDSRTTFMGLAILVAVLLSNFLFFRFVSYRSLLILLATLFPVIAAGATYYLTTTVDPALNLVLSLRPYFFYEFVRNVTWVEFLFGWPTEGSGVDNLFLMLLSSLGAIGSAALLLGISAKIYRMKPIMVSIPIVLLALSVFESSLIRPEIPISPLFAYLMGTDLFNRPRNTNRALMPVLKQVT